MSTQRGRGKQFETGNRYGRGRAVGSRNKATIAMQDLLDGEGEAITLKAIEQSNSQKPETRPRSDYVWID